MDVQEGLARLDSRPHLISGNSGLDVEVLLRSLPDRLTDLLALLGFLTTLEGPGDRLAPVTGRGGPHRVISLSRKQFLSQGQNRLFAT